MPLRSVLIALVSLVATGLASARESNVRLPDIGSSAAAIMSPQEARRYGASMLHEMRSLNMVLDDPLLGEYINTLGYRLVAHSDKPDTQYTFFVVRDSGINAFAAPGGYIGTNAGLITTAENEDEVAAVLAHEIAHISQNHLFRAFEDSKKASLPIALAMIGAMIAASGASGDGAEAALMTGTSLIQQRQINFTRKDEIEADRVGIQTLVRSHFDPQAMAGFFARMERTLRGGGGDGKVPDLLRTHPVTTDRISDAKARAEGMEKLVETDVDLPTFNGSTNLAYFRDKKEDDFGPSRKPPAPASASPPRGETRSLMFLLMRERARVLASDQPTATQTYYASYLKNEPSFDTPPNRYGHALALIRTGQPQQAREILAKLADGAPSNLPYQIALAQAEAQSGRRNDALTRYEKLVSNSPGSNAIALSFAQTLIEDGQVSSARRAQELLRPILATEIDDPEPYRVFARASDLAGDQIRAAEAYADVALLNGRLEDALNQLKALTKRSDLDYYQRARIDARIAEVTPIVLELRHRGIRPADQGRLAPGFSCQDSNSCASMSSVRNNSALK
ncbi:MAG TPA: M48 family metalloprotease [Tahibacter sp.]|nr:M48 family metalloprotease [Tahibacter sp.]